MYFFVFNRSNFKVKLHEGYNSANINNDICLLFLEGEADFSSPNIGPIALPADGECLKIQTDLGGSLLQVRSTPRAPNAL